jgi:membrane-bound serine protease (ClpP class)
MAMRTIARVLGFLAFLLAVSAGPGLAALPAESAAGTSPVAAGATVFVLPVKGPIDKAMLFVFRRAFRQVRELQPEAVVVEIETPGGGLRETEEIIGWLRTLDVPTLAFVNTHAQSAGAIIALACDRIYMAPGSRIGSALPILINPMGGGVQEMPADVKEKIRSDTRSLVRGLAQENGHWEEAAMAMVDPQIEVRVGDRVINEEGNILNLTAKEAIEIIPPRTTPVLARAIVPDLATLLAAEEIVPGRIVEFEETSAERLARLITLVGPLLLALGVLGLYIEFKTPGFGLPGIAGLSLLVLYFFGHYVAGLAGIEELVLVCVGFLLLGIEVFVLPGFGVVGALGILCLLAGVLLGLIPQLPQAPPPPLPEWNPIQAEAYLLEALLKLLATLVAGGLGVWALSKVLPRTPMFRSLVLTQELTRESGYVAHTAGRYEDLAGKSGVALTLLRPAGTAEVAGRRLDVVSSGDMIPPGSAVRVITVEGSRIVVEAMPAAPASAAAGSPAALPPA